MSRLFAFGWHNVLPTFHYPTSGEAIAGIERQFSLIKRWADVVRLDEMSADLRAGRAPRRTTAVLTFDDGYADALDVIAPILVSLDLPATFFLVPSFLDGGHPWWEIDEHGHFGTRMLDWDGASALVAQGFEIGSHTMSHRRLTELSADEQLAELSTSGSMLSSRLGVPVVALAYPFGDAPSVDAGVVESATAAGYSLAFTTRPGVFRHGDDPLRIPRFNMDPSRSRRSFDQVPRNWFGKMRSKLSRRPPQR